MTANLTLDYKAPLPTEMELVVTVGAGQILPATSPAHSSTASYDVANNQSARFICRGEHVYDARHVSQRKSNPRFFS